MGWWALALGAVAWGTELPSSATDAAFAHHGDAGVVVASARFHNALPVPVDAVLVVDLPDGVRVDAVKIAVGDAARDPTPVAADGAVAFPVPDIGGQREVIVDVAYAVDLPAWPGPDPRVLALTAPRLVVGALADALAAEPAVRTPLVVETAPGPPPDLSRGGWQRVPTGAAAAATVTVRPVEP